MSFRFLSNMTGWLVFSIATTVYALTCEPTGSLWDCGEFISAAYKLQVVHPPGAPFFLMLGRLFAWVASMFSDNPETIAYSINLLSGVCTAFTAAFMCWVTIMLAKLALVGRENEPSNAGDTIAILAAGLVSGLSTTFATSVWFSAVEGEVYAMSSAFTGLSVWAMMRWYTCEDETYADRWLVFIAFVLGLGSTVHLLGLLTIPVFTLMYYIKKNEGNITNFGAIRSLVIGTVILFIFNFIAIPQLPTLGAGFDKLFVNSFGLPFGSGFAFFVLAIAGTLVYGIKYFREKNNYTGYMATLCTAVALLGFSAYAMIIIRANANTPINMNDPSDPYTLVSYLKREQYGDRPLFYGPHFDARPVDSKSKGDVFRPVGKRYEKVDEKLDYVYANEDQMLIPRLGHSDRPEMYRMWLDLPEGVKPTMSDNIRFMLQYQIGWMYCRYFAWNFIGRQNAEQGYFSSDPTNGNWLSGVETIDNARLYDQTNIPTAWRQEEGRNTYFFLPFIFGLLGMAWHYFRRNWEANVVMLLFLMTGLAIILFLNQPPQEPRERDYGFAGSIFTFTIWIGMGVVALYQILRERAKLPALVAGAAASCMVLSAPLIMGFQNWDDHSRATHYAARDYASNFLTSLEPNAIIFTYGDNDTYPLWYAQEVEGIRTDVRVVNFSLLAVDWYINQLQRKMNKSEAIKMTMGEDEYRGQKRNIMPMRIQKKEMSLTDLVKFMGEKHPISTGFGEEESFIPAKSVFVPIDRQGAAAKNLYGKTITADMMVDTMRFSLPYDPRKGENNYLRKDEIAVLDILANNIDKRPVYFAVTVRPEKFVGVKNYLNLEGLALRVVPVPSREDSRFGVSGYGRVDREKMYNAIMKNWKWGNFNTHKTFVDKSYMPSVQSMFMSFMRLTEDMLGNNPDPKRANELVKKYFEAFPHNNFPLDKFNGINILNLGLVADSTGTTIKPHVIEMANSVAEHLNFYSSLDGQEAYMEYMSARARRDENAMRIAENQLADYDLFHFKNDYGQYMSYATRLQQIAEDTKDQDLIKQVNQMLGGYVGTGDKLK